MKQIKTIQSKKGDSQWFRELPPVTFQPDDKEVEMKLIMVYSDITYQTITGFGGAFTQASAYNYA